MPKMRGETDQEWMERLRRHREEIGLRTRATVCLLNAQNSGHADHMGAFLDLFHPELSWGQRHELVSDARRRDQRR